MALWLTASCKSGTPKQFIQPDEMEDILVDYHLAMALADETNQRVYNQQYYVESVLREHGVTRTEFDSSLVYYYTRSDRFSLMYRRVLDRLEEKALSLGATEGEIGKYAMLNAEGDTANIWPDRRTLLLLPIPPFNRLDFALEADSTYKKGDVFLMQFMADYMFQDGVKDGVFYVAVEYPDTVVSRISRFHYSGLNQLRIETADTACVKGLKGFFYLGGANEQSTTLRLLFINSIQLIRFHKKDEPKKQTQDSVARIEAAQWSEPDTASHRDTVGGRVKLLPSFGRAVTNRMVSRPDSAKAR